MEKLKPLGITDGNLKWYRWYGKLLKLLKKLNLEWLDSKS